ncbi:hypothetical protein F4819DRAFT_491387 [Hypoxylon fuscum]|nr:hypothetical protein F4819DRAFT_491387 [Hypoxylon fuscum]
MADLGLPSNPEGSTQNETEKGSNNNSSTLLEVHAKVIALETEVKRLSAELYNVQSTLAANKSNLKRDHTVEAPEVSVSHLPQQPKKLRPSCPKSWADCVYSAVHDFVTRYGPHFEKFCNEITKHGETCIFGSAFQMPLMPLSVQWSRFAQLWINWAGRDIPFSFVSRLQLGCAEHRHGFRFQDVMLLKSREEFNSYYCFPQKSGSSRCGWERCINIHHWTLEPFNRKTSRKICFDRSSRLFRESRPIPTHCDSHGPPHLSCLLQMRHDNPWCVIYREFLTANHLVGANAEPYHNKIVESQIGRFMPDTVGKDMLRKPIFDNDQAGIILSSWERGFLKTNSTGINIKHTYSTDEASSILAWQGHSFFAPNLSVFLRALEYYGEYGGALCIDEYRDLLGSEKTNRHSGFGASRNRYMCALCDGIRAKLCANRTPIQEDGFNDLRSALVHILNGHEEYFLSVKLWLLRRELDSCPMVKEAYKAELRDQFDNCAAWLGEGKLQPYFAAWLKRGGFEDKPV